MVLLWGARVDRWKLAQVSFVEGRWQRGAPVAWSSGGMTVRLEKMERSRIWYGRGRGWGSQSRGGS